MDVLFVEEVLLEFRDCIAALGIGYIGGDVVESVDYIGGDVNTREAYIYIYIYKGKVFIKGKFL